MSTKTKARNHNGIAPWQIKVVQTLISKRNLRDHKADIVSEYTHGRGTSVKDLNFIEANALIDHLNGGKKEVEKESAKYKMKMKILSMAHELGWQLVGGKIDMERVNAWCNKYGHMHVDLDKYHEADLPTLVSQFEKMYTEAIKNVK